MPQSIQQAERALALFEQTANKTSEKGSIVFKNGALVSRGRVGTTFSRNASRRAAVDALLTSITTKYGPQVADAVSYKLDVARRKAKPLRAATVRDVLASAARESQAAKDNNVIRLRQHFAVNGFAPAIRAFAEKNHLSKPQRQELKAVVERELTARIRLFPDAEKPQTLEELNQKVENGLPCMKIMLDMFKPGTSASVPLQIYAPYPDDRPDVAWLQGFVPPQNSEELGYVLQCLPEMRKAQPEGPLTLSTVWNACFKEAPPDGLELHSADLPKAWNQRFMKLFADKLEEHNVDPSDEVKKFDVKVGLAYGLKLDTAMACAAQPGRITLEDMCSLLNASLPRAMVLNLDKETAAHVEEAIANDIRRLILPSMVSNAFSFTRQDGTVTTIHPMSTEGLGPEDQKEWARGHPSSRSREIMEAAASLCAPEAHAQKLAVASCFHQGALALARAFSGLVGGGLSEHSGYNISVRAGEMGDVYADFKTPEGSKSLHEMTFVIHADGSSYITRFDMRPIPDYVEPDVNAAAIDASIPSSTFDYSEYYGNNTSKVAEAAVPGKTVKPESEL